MNSELYHENKRIGWWEEYRCGCVSETVKHKKDLTGYCKHHGDDRRRIYPEYEPVESGGSES